MPSMRPLPRTSPIRLCFSLRRFKPADTGADLERVRLQLLAVDHLQHGHALRADDRIAAEGVEVDPLRERLRDLRRRDDRAERAPLPMPFAMQTMSGITPCVSKPQ